MVSQTMIALAALMISSVSAQLVYSPYLVPSVYVPTFRTGWVWGSNKDQPGSGPDEIRGHITAPLTNDGVPSPLSEDAPLRPPTGSMMSRLSPMGGAPPMGGPQMGGVPVPPGLNIPIGQGASFEPLAPSTTAAPSSAHARAPQRPAGPVQANGMPYPPMPSPKPITLEEFSNVATTTKKP